MPSLARLRKELWKLCKLITRKRYLLEDGTWVCYTCGSKIDKPKKAHTGHGIPDAFGGLLLRYDLRNLRVQDMRCNFHFGGNGAVYLMKLRDEIGDEEVDDMFRLLAMKDFEIEERSFLLEKIDDYKKILETLS